MQKARTDRQFRRAAVPGWARCDRWRSPFRPGDLPAKVPRHNENSAACALLQVSQIYTRFSTSFERSLYSIAPDERGAYIVIGFLCAGASSSLTLRVIIVLNV